MSIGSEIEEVKISFEESSEVLVREVSPEIVLAGSAQLGPQGPQGPPGEWTALTQAEYDALDPPDPDMLYIIVA